MFNKKLISSVVGIAAFILSYAFYGEGNFGYNPLHSLIVAIPVWTAKAVADGGVAVIFVLMTLESSSLPIPSEVILPLSGYLVSLGKLNLYLVLFAAIAGSIIGSIADYYIGLLIGIEGIEKRKLISENNLKKAVEWFKKYGAYAVFFTRMLPGMRTLISFPAGAFKMNLFRFILFTFLGSFLWSLVLLYIGILLGNNWGHAINIINRVLVPAAIGVTVAFLVYIALSIKK
ncbi:MAG: DedA family protein [Nitrososphaeria archaeon]|nr:DedA family protein [Conexivisphaerales archaeon]